jgi:kanamycin kinase/aminoglycoside 3'-phosphotransferase-3
MDILNIIDRLGKETLPWLPESVRRGVEGKPFTVDDVGRSGSQIFIFDDCVLKIVPYDEKNELAVKTMRWLEGKIPVPRVLAFEEAEISERSVSGNLSVGAARKHYILMSKVPGKMSCDEYYLEHPRELCRLLAQAFKMLWSVDLTGCPRERTIEKELEEAKYRVENNLVDLDDAEPDTFSENGFENPQALLAWLQTHKPEYEPVLSHGDFCLPNIFLKDNHVSGFIDLGAAGIGDKWRDIALCYRSLKHNCDGTFGGKIYPDVNPDLLLEELGIEPNHEKIRYYILLDELF